MSGAAVPFADLALARRLERAEATSSTCFVDARARLFPSSGACWPPSPRSTRRDRVRMAPRSSSRFAI